MAPPAMAPASDSTASIFDELDAAHEQKRHLKKAIRDWELEFEEAHGGLVATHEDKKHDPKYLQIKAQAKSVEKTLEVTRAKTRKATRTSKAEKASAGPPVLGRGGSGTGGVGRSSNGLGGSGSHSSLQSSSDRDDDGTRHAFTFEGGRISLSPFHVTMLFMACIVPYAVFMTGFSLMGMGALIFDYLVSSGRFFYPLSLSAVALLLILYLFDVSYWEHPAAVSARRLLLSIAGATVVLGGTLVSKEYPYAPLLLLFCLAPGYWWLLQSRVFGHWPLNQYLEALFIALVLLSIGAATLWVAWVLNGNNWDLANKRRYMLQMRCCHPLEDLPQQLYDSGYTVDSLLTVPPGAVVSLLNVTAPVSTSSVWDGLRWPTSSANVSLIGSPSMLAAASGNLSAVTLEEWEATVGAASGTGLLAGSAIDESGCLVLPQRPCLSVLLFWVSPFVTACAGVIAALLCALLARHLKVDEQSGPSTAVSVGGRIFIMGVAMAAASLWVSASIAGASMGVTKVILQGLCVIILVMAVLIDRMFGWKAVLQAIVTREPLARRLIRFFLTSDYSRASVVAIGSPLLIAGLGLSVLNQIIRVHMLRTVVLPAERATLLTTKVDRLARRLYAWNWTSVLRKVIILCFAYMVWVVGIMKVTTLFFSWLSHMLKPLPLVLTTGVFIGVGMCMFLLPPVPGAPVYMASGVLLTATAQDRLGFAGAALYAMGVGFVIKLGACTLQQKIIGANLGRSVAVRSAVLVNTPLMRALKLLMLQPGIYTRGKVATLVGGPDWPISVMMGILGMPLLPVLGGTLPVICLVAPLSLSGSFMIMGPVTPFPALTNIALALSSISQLGMMVAMLHYVERVTQSNRDELDQMPYDEEVLALDRARADYQALYAELTGWHSKEVPTSMRVLLVVGAFLGISACQVATLFDDECFRAFALYPDFPTQLRDNLGGRVSNLILTPGYGVLLASVLSILCRAVFRFWAGRFVKARFAAGQRSRLVSSAEAATAAPAAAGRAHSGSGSGHHRVSFSNGARASGGGGGAGGAQPPPGLKSQLPPRPSPRRSGSSNGSRGETSQVLRESVAGAGTSGASGTRDGGGGGDAPMSKQEVEKARQEALAQQRLAEMAPVLRMQDSQKAMAAEAKAKAAAAAAAASNADHMGLDPGRVAAVPAQPQPATFLSERASKADATKARPPKQKTRHRSDAGGGQGAAGSAPGASNAALVC